MTKQLLIVVILANTTRVFGQAKYEPQILILSPNVTRHEKSFDKEILSSTAEIKKNAKASEGTINSQSSNKQPENIQIITKSEIEYFKSIDFFKQVSFMSEQFLAYRFFERFPNLLIKLKDTKSNGSLSDLKGQSENEKLQYVLNFPSIEIYKENKISYAKIAVQLYDSDSHSILLEKSYVGDWNNPGFEFACNDQSINCTLNNALSQALNEVIRLIASNSPTLKRERQLQQERNDVLVKNYLTQSFDKQSLKNIISPLDSNINIDISYQALFSDDRNKFVAFFLQKVSAQDFKAFNENKKDKNVNIISSKDIKDEGFLKDIPQTYAYIVIGIHYNGKWYYKKSNATYFEIDNQEAGKKKYFSNLQNWHFFKENSVDFSPAFWETYFFSRIESEIVKNKEEIDQLKLSVAGAKSKEEKEVYQDMIDDYYEKDAKNREYIGQYQIVANELTTEKRKQNEIFAAKIKDHALNDFYERRSKKNGIEQFVKMNGKEYALIYPSDKSVLLAPIVTDYGNKKLELNYYVLIPNEKDSYDIYSWNYFTPVKPLHNSIYGHEIHKQLNELTKWNFSFDTLDDKDFWTNYVLVKDGVNYKYLRKVQ